MTKRILLIAIALALVLAVLYLGYGSYDAKRAGASGDVYSNDSSSGRLKTSGEAAASDTSSSRAVSSSTTETAKPVTYPSAAEQSARAGDSSGTASTSSTTAMPSTDSINPNPPNGEVFAGTGKYQLYRQGNITWRLNTDTGQSCILFATDEEWKKSKVMRAGCAGR